jgi:hypothetical protein
MLVSNEEGSWYQAIARLLTDACLRQSIQEESRALVEKEYSLNTFALLLLNQIDEILSTSSKSAISGNNLIPKNGLLTNHQKQIRAFSQIIQIPISGLQKIHKSIRNYGAVITFRLILDQLERYITYFGLSRRLRHKKI